MLIRDSLALISGDDTIIKMKSGGIEIVGDDNRALLCIDQKDNKFRISTTMVCKHNGRILDDRFYIKPVAGNVIELTIPVYKK